jgi:archaellum biogenesis protein FlaJ (TadC family)
MTTMRVAVGLFVALASSAVVALTAMVILGLIFPGNGWDTLVAIAIFAVFLVAVLAWSVRSGPKRGRTFWDYL